MGRTTRASSRDYGYPSVRFTPREEREMEMMLDRVRDANDRAPAAHAFGRVRLGHDHALGVREDDIAHPKRKPERDRREKRKGTTRRRRR